MVFNAMADETDKVTGEYRTAETKQVGLDLTPCTFNVLSLNPGC